MRVLFIIILLLSSSCTPKKTIPEIKQLNFNPPSTIIYKTKKDYQNNIPIILSEDKKRIVQYFAPTDVHKNGILTLPKQLKNGYLLDNQGINLNVAFLKKTYQEYSKLKEAPSLQELYRNILDKDPILEFCDCGNRFQFENDSKIERFVEKRLNECKKLK